MYTLQDWARCSGEEFVLAIFDLPDEKLKETAEAVRQSYIWTLPILRQRPTLTVSIGFYSAPITVYEPLSYFLGQADEAIYETKRAGQNTVKLKRAKRIICLALLLCTSLLHSAAIPVSIGQWPLEKDRLPDTQNR
ncbi:GGDEF domain-containing protein [Terribacillus aidingensis]|uniref:GGDEF domain-containing protein n=1 Tax=Terribacillus aidingensis TaxID=586416 RepID=UPI003CCBFD42